MNVSLEEALKTVFGEMDADAPPAGPTPTALDVLEVEPARALGGTLVRSLVGAAAVVALVVGGIVVLARRDGSGSSIVPADSVIDEPVVTVEASLPDEPAGSVELTVDDAIVVDLPGPLLPTLEPVGMPASIDLGQTANGLVQLTTDGVELCIVVGDAGSGCTIGAPKDGMFAAGIGPEMHGVATDVIVVAGSVNVLIDPAIHDCELTRRPAPTIGDMVVWVCDGGSQSRFPDGATFIATPGAIPFVDRTTQVDPPVGSPVAVTGFRIGDPARSYGRPLGFLPDFSYDESSVPVWVSVVDDSGLIIGYVKWPEPEPSSPDQTVGPSIIYGEDGQPIGSFVDGSPVITYP